METKITRKLDMEELRELIRRSSKETAIYVGCDSVVRKKKLNVFVIAVVIHHDSCRGGSVKYETRIIKSKERMTVRERLLKEVEYAVEIGVQLADIVEDRPFEIHLDVNPKVNTGSNVIIKEAIGWVISQGLACKVKPNAFAATCCADHFGKLN